MKTQKFPWLAFALIFPTVFLIGILAVLGMNVGNQIASGPSLRQAINLISTNQVSVFTAQGEAHLPVIPDEAKVTLGVTVTETTVKTAQDNANTIINKFKDDLANLGIEKNKIKTNNYSLYPNYDWESATRRILSYTVSSNLEVTLTDFDLLNQVIDLATADGINEIGSINFTLSDSKLAELKQEARKIAIDAAKLNADNLAHLTGIQLGNIVNVQENETNYNDGFNPIMAKSVAYDTASGGSPTNVEAGETVYDYYVTLSYQTL